MNKILIFLVFLYLSLDPASALRRKDKTESGLETVQPPPGHEDGSFLETQTDTSFDLNNFYEYSGYFASYAIYFAYVNNAKLSCNSYKMNFFFAKKLDALALASLCQTIGNSIGSSYLKVTLYNYLIGLASSFNRC